jgi:hypothetical protein
LGKVVVSCGFVLEIEFVTERDLLPDSVFSFDCDGVVEGGEPLRDAEEALRVIETVVEGL